MTDKLRGGKYWGKKWNMSKLPFSQFQHWNWCCLLLQKPAVVGWEVLSHCLGHSFDQTTSACLSQSFLHAPDMGSCLR